jgi:hypothetical protein
MSLHSPPDPEVRKLLERLVKSQERTDRWMLRLTIATAMLTAAGLIVALVALLEN